MFFLAVLVAFWMLWFAVGSMAGAAAPARPSRPLPAARLLLRPGPPRLSDHPQGTYGFQRSIGEIRAFSADIASLLSASEDLLVWGWVRVFQRPESNLFPGLTIVLLSGVRGVGGAPAARAACRLAADAAHPTDPRRPARRAAARQRPADALRLVAADGGGHPTACPSRAPTSRCRWRWSRRSRCSRCSPASAPRSIAARCVAFYLLAAFATWMFALGPGSDVHGSARNLPGAVRLADGAARLRRTPRAGPVLDDDSGVPEHRGRARRPPAHRTQRARSSSRSPSPDCSSMDGRDDSRFSRRRRSGPRRLVVSRAPRPSIDGLRRRAARSTSRCSIRSRSTTASAATRRRTTTPCA